MSSDPIMKLENLRFYKADEKKIISFNRKDTINKLSESNLIISNSGSIISIGIKAYLKLFMFSNIKHLNIATGSDFSEFLVENTMISKLFRYHVKRSQANWVFPVPNVIRNLRINNLKNIFISRHPFFLSSNEVGVVRVNPVSNLRQRNKVIFFHPSNLDWACQDNKKNRNSTKGNNRFLLQFMKATDVNSSIHCLILDRGPDRDIARRLISEHGKEKFFTWMKPMSSSELIKYFVECDVVVDQFDVGCPGMIAMESMSQGKPVMIYIDKNYWPLVYNEEPPVINCCTEDEIYKAILEWADRKKLQELGEKAEKWVRKYHDVHTADFSEFILRVCLAAGLEWPRKDLSKID
jgi:hypothetical protein